MKAAMNCSRKATANHCERRFDVSKADHIDKERMKDNVYLYYGGNEKPWPKFLYEEEGFKKMELEFYMEHFSDSLERKNCHYRKKGNLKQLKTIEDLYLGEKTKPEELILQFGNKDDHPDSDFVITAFKKYIEEFNVWNKKHGNHIRILDAAIHLDEATPHIHLRRVYVYEDRYGDLDIGVKRALEQAGIKLPDAEKEEGRFNNLKMTFDALMRDLWIYIGRCLGLELESAPKKGRRGELDIHAYKLEQTKKDLDVVKNIRDQLNEEIQDMETYASQLQDDINEIEQGAIEKAFDLIEQISTEEKEEPIR